MIWSSHSQYGLYHQSSRLRPQSPQDAMIARRLEEAAEELQAQYWKSLYPEKIKKIQQEIERTCDALDYAGRFIYDEYPDKLQLRLMCRRIQNNVKVQEKEKWDDDRLRDMTEVLLYQELLKRREEKRRRQKRIIW